MSITFTFCQNWEISFTVISFVATKGEKRKNFGLSIWLIPTTFHATFSGCWWEREVFWYYHFCFSMDVICCEPETAYTWCPVQNLKGVGVYLQRDLLPPSPAQFLLCLSLLLFVILSVPRSFGILLHCPIPASSLLSRVMRCCLFFPQTWFMYVCVLFLRYDFCLVSFFKPLIESYTLSYPAKSSWF